MEGGDAATVAVVLALSAGVGAIRHSGARNLLIERPR